MPRRKIGRRKGIPKVPSQKTTPPQVQKPGGGLKPRKKPKEDRELKKWRGGAKCRIPGSLGRRLIHWANGQRGMRYDKQEHMRPSVFIAFEPGFILGPLFFCVASFSSTGLFERTPIQYEHRNHREDIRHGAFLRAGGYILYTPKPKIAPQIQRAGRQAGAIKQVRRAGWEWAACFFHSKKLRGLSARAQVRV